jgi:hypothetical protein
VFVELPSYLVRPIFAEPSVTSVPHDFQQPGTSIAAKLKAVKGVESTQVRLLHDILSVMFITRKPPGKVIRGIQVRQNGLFKVLDFTYPYRIVRHFIPPLF